MTNNYDYNCGDITEVSSANFISQKSEWVMHVGGKNGLYYEFFKTVKVPNWFQRKMLKAVFGVEWVKRNEK